MRPTMRSNSPRGPWQPMQAEQGADQASGLRRLLVRPAAPIWAFSGTQPGSVTSALVTGLAADLSRQGCDVLVLDENLSHDTVAHRLSMKPRLDLLHVLRGDKSLADVMLEAAPGLRVLPMARILRDFPRLGREERSALAGLFDRIIRSAEVILVDAANQAGAPRPGDGESFTMVLVMDCTAAGLKAGYALIKRLHQEDGLTRFGIVMDRVSDPSDAEWVFGNLARVARDHLALSLEWLGTLPVDEPIHRATQLRFDAPAAVADVPASVAIRRLGQVLMGSLQSGRRPADPLSW